MAKISKQVEGLGWKLLGQNLGRGGQGDVELVERLGEPGGQKYAFKYLGERGGKNAHQRFRDELAALTRVNHPGIVKIVEYAQNDDAFQYYVIDHVEGAQSLRRRMDRNTNPFLENPLKAIDGFIQIVEALAECAKFNIVHRDLSPANVLVTEDARIFLIDFGLCHIDDGNRVTVTDEAVGTPQYQPPECTRYSPTPPTIKSDLYSAGKLLWSMVTNKAAFAREQPVFNDLSLVHMLPHVKQSWHLFHIFEQTIRHDPRHRFTNAASALETTKWVRTLIADNMKPLEQLTVDTCPLCGIGRYPNFIQLHVHFNDETNNFYKLSEPVKGSYAVCPYCFHASFVAVEALQKRLDQRKQLQ